MKSRKSGHYTQSLRYEKENMLKIAKELFYGPRVIEKLKKATSSEELSRIMNNARKGVI